MAEAEAHVVDPQPQQEHQDEEQPKTQSPSETEPQNEASIQSQTQPQPVDAPLSISDTTIPPAAAVVAASTPIASANTSNTARDKQIVRLFFPLPQVLLFLFVCHQIHFMLNISSTS